MPPLKVTHKSDAEVPTEIIAENIVAIGAGMKKFRAGRLNDRALMLLLHHSSGVSQRSVQDVLNAMADLERVYLRKKS